MPSAISSQFPVACTRRSEQESAEHRYDFTDLSYEETVMGLEIEDLGPASLELRVLGRLEKDDYKECLARFEDRLKDNEKIGLLVHIGDFHGWSPGALWEDLKFDVKHYRDVSRFALVAESPGKKWMATVSSPFTGAKVEFFTEDQLDEAREWVKSAPATRTA
jgi:hypothetical protein